MTDQVTMCCNCKHPVEKKGPGYVWRCIKHPARRGFGYVTDTDWDDDAPYLRCRDVNGGMCPLYEREEHEDRTDVSE